MRQKRLVIWLACQLIAKGLAILKDQELCCRHCDHMTGHFRSEKIVYVFSCAWSGLTTDLQRPICPAFHYRKGGTWRKT